MNAKKVPYTADPKYQKNYKVAPRNAEQALYFDEMEKNKLIFGIGPAGTGKTYLAAAFAAAVENNEKSKIDTIVFVRPPVEVGKSIGYLPGSADEKLKAFMEPFMDALNDVLGEAEVRKKFNDRSYIIGSLGHMRGRTLKNSIVLLDEAQNTTPQEMKMLVTRFGAGAKMIITGDIDDDQRDLRVQGQSSGLDYALNTFGSVRHASCVELIQVERDPLVADIIEAVKSPKAMERKKPGL